MRRTNALQDMLQNLARVFGDAGVEVRWSDSMSYASTTGRYVGVTTNLRGVYNVDVEPAQELRLIVNLLSHEMEHIRESDLESKKRFVEHYEEAGLPPSYVSLAGMVINVLEDIYVDATRLRRYPGLRGAHAYFVHEQIDRKRGTHVGGTLPLARRLTVGFWEVCHTGTANGIEKAEPVVVRTLSQVRDIAQRVRHAGTPDERTALAHEAMDVLLAVLPEHPDRATELAIKRGLGKVQTDAHPGDEPVVPDEPDDDKPDRGLDEFADDDALDADVARRTIDQLLGDVSPGEAVIRNLDTDAVNTPNGVPSDTEVSQP